MRRFLGFVIERPSTILLFVLLLLIAIVAVFGELWWGVGARSLDPLHANAPPSAQHVLGTDGLGRDILDRTLIATRLSLELALIATAIAAVLGYGIGAGLSVVAPSVRRVGLTVIDVMLSFPGILVAIFVTAILGVGQWSATVAIGIALAPGLARVSYTVAAAAIGTDYVAAAQALGVRPLRLFRRHLLPNIAEPLLITASFAVGTSLITVSSLSFLGLGVQAPSVDWGSMLSDGIRSFYTTPAQALAPAIAITVTGLTLGLGGEALARLSNPVLRRNGTKVTRTASVSLAEVTAAANRNELGI